LHPVTLNQIEHRRRGFTQSLVKTPGGLDTELLADLLGIFPQTGIDVKPAPTTSTSHCRLSSKISQAGGAIAVSTHRDFSLLSCGKKSAIQIHR